MSVHSRNLSFGSARLSRLVTGPSVLSMAVIGYTPDRDSFVAFPSGKKITVALVTAASCSHTVGDPVRYTSYFSIVGHLICDKFPFRHKRQSLTMLPCNGGILTWSTCLVRIYKNPDDDQKIECKSMNEMKLVGR